MDPTPSVAPTPDAETIRRTAEEILRRPEYQLEPSSDAGAAILKWLLRLWDWITRPFQWLVDIINTLPSWLKWPIVVALVALLVGLVLHIGYTIARAMAGPGRRRGAVPDVAEATRDPIVLERRAAEAAAAADFINAIRLLFLACLLRLEQAEKRAFRAGTTNREHLRRHRATPVYEPLRQFVETIETRWYGPGECRREDFEACRAAHARIRDLAQERAHAHRA